eukprot:m51a1_g220 hypothetical protein (475) ;mRNA; r:43337-45254
MSEEAPQDQHQQEQQEPPRKRKRTFAAAASYSACGASTIATTTFASLLKRSGSGSGTASLAPSKAHRAPSSSSPCRLRPAVAPTAAELEALSGAPPAAQAATAVLSRDFPLADWSLRRSLVVTSRSSLAWAAAAGPADAADALALEHAGRPRCPDGTPGAAVVLHACQSFELRAAPGPSPAALAGRASLCAALVSLCARLQRREVPFFYVVADAPYALCALFTCPAGSGPRAVVNAPPRALWESLRSVPGAASLDARASAGDERAAGGGDDDAVDAELAALERSARGYVSVRARETRGSALAAAAVPSRAEFRGAGAVLALARCLASEEATTSARAGLTLVSPCAFVDGTLRRARVTAGAASRVAADGAVEELARLEVGAGAGEAGPLLTPETVRRLCELMRERHAGGGEWDMELQTDERTAHINVDADSVVPAAGMFVSRVAARGGERDGVLELTLRAATTTAGSHSAEQSII